MRREPKKASSIKEAYYELTKPSITFMILVSTALGYVWVGMVLVIISILF